MGVETGANWDKTRACDLIGVQTWENILYLLHAYSSLHLVDCNMLQINVEI